MITTIILLFLFSIAEYIAILTITIDMYLLKDIFTSSLQSYTLILCLLLPLMQIATIYYTKKKEQTGLSNNSKSEMIFRVI